VRFEQHVERALAALPPELRQAVRNVEISVEDEHPDEPDLFGLYEGVPLPDSADLEEEIRVTVLHELAHYFELDEDRLDDLGYS